MSNNIYRAEVSKSKDVLPPEGIYVLVHLNSNNWIANDIAGVYWDVATLKKGVSMKEREAMENCKRKRIYRSEDEFGNNTAPYCWEPFGPSTYFGQEVDEWMHLPHNLPNVNSKKAQVIVRKDEEMSLKQEIFKDTVEKRGIPFAAIGMRVELEGKTGAIKGVNSSANLDILFDGEKQKTNCHPTWEMVYFNGNGSICKDYREKQNSIDNYTKG